MDNFLGFLFLFPLFILVTFQGALLQNAEQVEQTISLALYEGQKEAALKGKYDEEIYNKIKEYLVEIHHYDESVIKIKGTETLTPRGERMYVEISVPKPKMSVIEMFKIWQEDEPFAKGKYIMSEYRG